MTVEAAQQPWTAKVWVSPQDDPSDPQYVFPEQVAGLVSNAKTGICFSGGGTRSLTACLGQLRALTSRALLDDVGYLSCVSGGSWAGTVFTYNPSGSDADLLGKPVPPDQLTFEMIRSREPEVIGNLGRTALQSGFDLAERLYDQSFEENLLWYEVVGDLFFAPFGLFNPFIPNGRQPALQRYFAFDEANVDDIKRRNPSLRNAIFHTVRQPSKGVSPRPFLIDNATLMGPQNRPNQPRLYRGLEMTPLYVGLPKLFDLKYPTRGPTLFQDVHFGGGFVESFAFGTFGPSKLPQTCQPKSSDGSQCVQVAPPGRHFNMVEASALSSAFFAQLLASYFQETSFTPVRDIWPVADHPIPPKSTAFPVPTLTDYFIGDGGLLENFGVVSLLLRGVERIAIFVNTDTPVDVNYDPAKAPAASQLDTVVVQLFGREVAGGKNPFPLDHVFEADGGCDANGKAFQGFADLVKALQAAKMRDEASPGEWAGVVAETRLKTVANSNWGLSGGRFVDVVWVYLDRVKEWEALLPATPDPDPEHDFNGPWTFEQYIRYGNGMGSENPFGVRYEPVPAFPNYLLARENNDVEPDFQLTPFQVNLMSNLTWWVVDENADKFKAFFQG